MNRVAELLFRNASAAAIKDAERGIQQTGELIKSAKLNDGAVAYFAKLQSDYIEAVRQIREATSAVIASDDRPSE